MLGNELSEEIRSTQVHLIGLRERVRDDQLRELIARYINEGAVVPISKDKDQATQRMDRWLETMTTVQERLGMVLRTLL